MLGFQATEMKEFTLHKIAPVPARNGHGGFQFSALRRSSDADQRRRLKLAQLRPGGEAPAQTMRLPRIEALMPSAVPGAISKTQEGWRLKSAVQYGYAAVVPFDG